MLLNEVDVRGLEEGPQIALHSEKVEQKSSTVEHVWRGLSQAYGYAKEIKTIFFDRV